MTSGGRALVEALEAWGVEVVFGIPGIHTLAIYDALYQHPRIRHVTTRHEQGAGYMADGYARAGGRVGVVLTTTGPAAVNALTPLGEAYADSSPVLLITSGPSTRDAGSDLGVLHEMRDQFATLESVCGQGRRIETAEEIPGAVATAFAALERQRPRPYVLEVPLDLLEAQAQVPSPEARLDPPPLPAPRELEAAAALIRSSVRPLLVAGRGAQDAACEVRCLAERLQAPVGLSANGLGVLPADHPLCLGDAGPRSLDKRRRNLGRNFGPWVAQADLMIALGTRLGERTVRAWDAEPGRLIHLDLDPGVIDRRYPTAVGLVGEARASLQALLDLLGEETSRSSWSPKASADKVEDPGEEGIFPRIIATVRQGLDRDAVVTNDMTLVCYQARRLFPVYAPRTFLAPHYYGTLGFAVPAAIGAKLARPERQAVALCGDGGFLFTGQELATARQQGLSLPIILCNDDSYAAIRQVQDRDFGGRCTGVDLQNPDFVAFARSFGAGGVRVKSCPALTRALHQALQEERPTVIEVFLPEFEL